ncbi:MAG: hypothetical protein GX947_00610 [Tissierellia bacterium]|nr:hypothetical protein [Tissierellia bacterium]
MLNKRKLLILIVLILSIIFVGCGNDIQPNEIEDLTENKLEEIRTTVEKTEKSTDVEDKETEEPSAINEPITEESSQDLSNDKFEGYRVIKVDGGNTSGYREANVVVNIGYGDREYWAFTNEHGQLVRVVADEIILQDHDNESVNSNGRYYENMADVPGVGNGLDRGHVIADSLGGVANAYNITPQDSVLNRHGNQAYMEKVIRDAGGCIDFEAIITYPDTKTQIPSKYKYTYILFRNLIVDEFENVNPDEYNASIDINENENKVQTNTMESDTKELGKYKGSIKSDKYHLLVYTHGGQISDHNLIWFDSKEEAESKGYVPCKACF